MKSDDHHEKPQSHDSAHSASRLRNTPRPGHYIGIGASAGGLEAIESFFKAMPPQTGLAFIVVQHLSPDYKSMMVELLSKRTTIPVHRAENGMQVMADAIYLIPPKKKLTIFHGKLILSDPERSQSGIFLPIDILLRSLADDQGEKAVAVILSGTGSDGMRGVRAIKESGGMVMVQDETTAKFDGMPKSAISTGLADFILAPEEMPRQLLAFVDHPEQSRSARSDTILTDEDGLTRIFALLRERHKVDFTYYKPSTVVRRIERRMTINHIDELRDYVGFLASYPRELTILYRELLIGVTNFFRNPEAFELLSKEHLPALLQHTRDRQVRFWVAGCSTGEEAYTLAIACRECLQDLKLDPDIKIFATDVDNDAVAQAANGVYPESIAADLSPQYLSKYFIRLEGSFQVARNIREMVVFAQHNLIKDPPFTNIELVSCRNLLIYLQPVLQRKVLNNFNFSLNPSGVLFLGHSETIGDMTDYFEPLSHKWKIYRSKGKHSESGTELEISKARYRPKHLTLPNFLGPQRAMRYHEEERILDSLLDSLSGDYVPLTLVIDDQMQLLHVLGDASEILGYPSGRVTNDISRIVVKDLSIPLSTGIQKVFKSNQEVRYTNIRIRREGGTHIINLRIKPFTKKKGRPPMAAIFIEKPSLSTCEVTSDDTPTFDVDRECAQRIQDLEQELQFSRENLQATIEELETSNEELQATNEELLASNEELQSTNQELQSVNEELHTVNTEHQRKIMEMTELSNDIRNLMDSTGVGTMFIDENLEIRKYTHQIAKIFDISEADIGRPVALLTHCLENLDLVAAVADVHNGNQRVEKEVCTTGGHWYLMRIVPYSIGLKSFSGSIMTFIDIQDLKGSQSALQEERFRLDRQVRLLELISKLSALAETHDATVDRVAALAVDLIPAAYDPSKAIECSITVNGQVHHSGQFSECECQLEIPIIHNNNRIATMTLMARHCDADESIFAHADRRNSFWTTIADRMGLIFTKLNSEQALRESETRFRLLAENIQDVFWLRTSDMSRTFYVSPAYVKIWGRDAKQLYDDPTAFIQAVHADDRSRVAAQLERHAQGHWDVEYRIEKPDGSIAWVHDRGFPIKDGQGELSMMCGFAGDITEQKNRESMCLTSVAEFRSTFEKASVGIALIDMNGYLLECNETLNKMLGYSTAELQKRPFVQYTQSQDKARKLDLFKEIAAGRRDFLHIRECFECKNSELLYANLTTILIRDAGGKPGYTICLLEVVSDTGRE